MKNVLSSLLAVALIMGFVACTNDADSDTDKGVATASTAAGQNDMTAEVKSNADLNKPEYLRKAEELPKTTAEFKTEAYDFGKVNEGEEVYHKFEFTNSGSEDLVITYIRPSCGCTTPEWSEEPVAPGEAGYIDVKFDSKGKVGTQVKNITVFGNFEGQTHRVLKLTGEVISE